MPTTKTKKKKKHPRMEAKLVSKEKHEIKYVAKKAKTSQKKVKSAKAKVGRSRKKIMKELEPFGVSSIQ